MVITINFPFYFWIQIILLHFKYIQAHSLSPKDDGNVEDKSEGVGVVAMGDAEDDWR